MNLVRGFRPANVRERFLKRMFRKIPNLVKNTFSKKGQQATSLRPQAETPKEVLK